MTAAAFSDHAGDTPLRRVPADYECGGVGRWFVLPSGPDAGRRLFFWERRYGDGDGPVVLLVHGNPECSYTYRHVARALGERALPLGTRVIALDHLGFGRSDQASFEMVEMHHADNLRQLVEALDLREVTLVVHDWGGPIGIGAFLRDPQRVVNLVVLNSTVFPIPPEGPTYADYPVPVLLPWYRTASIVPDRLWGVHAAFAVGLTPIHPPGLLGGWAAGLVRSLLPGRDRVLDPAWVFRQQFASAANARSSKRMVRQTRVWGHGYTYDDHRLGRQDNHDFYARLQEMVCTEWGPNGQSIRVAGVFGAWDPLAKPSVLAQWREALPQVGEDLQVLQGVSHFVEEHRPEQVADAVTGLLMRA